MPTIRMIREALRRWEVDANVEHDLDNNGDFVVRPDPWSYVDRTVFAVQEVADALIADPTNWIKNAHVLERANRVILRLEVIDN